MSNNRFLKLAGIGALVGAGMISGAAIADNGPNYNYGEIGYTRIDIDDFDADGDLFGVSGSVALTDLFHLFGSYDDGEVDGDFSREIDATQMEVGAGVNYALSDTVDLVGRISWVSVELDAGGFGDVDDDGLGLAGGVRAMITPQFELNGGISYVDIEDSDDTTLAIGGVYSFTDLLAVTAGAGFGDDANSYSIGLRLYFNR